MRPASFSLRLSAVFVLSTTMFLLAQRAGSEPGDHSTILATLPILAGAQSAALADEAPPALPVEGRFLEEVFWTYTAGFDFSRGDYGLDRSSTLYYLPVGVIADYRRFRFRAVLPVLISDGPVSLRNQGAADAIEDRTETGLGEVALAGSYLFEAAAPGLPFVELGVQMTLPTRTSERLGTGDLAFAARIDLFQKIGPLTPFGSFGRSFYLVDSLDDRFFASVGTSLVFSDTISAGLSYDWFEATSRAPGDAHELVPFVSWKIARQWTLGPYGVIGLSDGSPDYGVGLGIRFAP